jgi:hypothetical protein
MTNKIYLSAVRDGDRFKLIDQDGREVFGLKGLDITTALDDATEFRATILDASLTAPHGPHLNCNAR